MKQINEKDELKLAVQMETEATLESASTGFEVAASKEKLKRAVVQETAAVDVSTDSALELAAARDKLVKTIKNESDAIDVEADSSLDLSVAKEELAKKISNANIQAKDEAETTEDLEKARKRRLEIEEELAKQQPLVDYSKQLNDLNAAVAEALKEKFDELKKSAKSEGSVRDVNDKYKKQAEKELASRRGIFKRVTKSLEKTAKTSESGMARMSSKMVLGASNMISDKINDFVNNIPVLGQVNKARQFIKENRSKADDAKHKRLVRERASELRSADRDKTKEPKPLSDFGKERKRRQQEQTKRGNERQGEQQISVLEKILEVLNAIRTTQLISSIAGMFTSLSKGLLSGIGGAVAGAFAKSGITKVLATLAGALGASKLAGKMLDGLKPKPTVPDVDPKQPKPKPGSAPTPEPPSGGNKPPTTKTPSPGDAAKGGKGGFIKAVGKALPWVARGAVRLMGPVGLAYTAYEIANMAGLTKPIDDMVGEIWDNLKGQTQAVTENQVDFTGDKPMPGKKEGDDGKLTILVTPGKEQLAVNDYVSRMQQCTADGTSFMDCKRQIKGTAESATRKDGDEIERLSEQKRKNDVERERRKEQQAIQTAAAISQSSSSGNQMNVNSTNVTNNSSISFNGSEYQTSHQKGSQVQR
ncbi:MAG: hypothetical protein ACRC9I_11595 [Acinetobacter sp.]